MEITLAIIIIAVVLLLYLIQIGKEHNKTDWGSSGLNVLDGINRWFCLKYHRLPPNMIALPESGPAILVSNHISGLDPLLLIAATTRPLRFMIAQEEYDRWWLRWLFKKIGCIPVKRDKNPKKALNHSIAALEKGEILGVFPQGGIVINDDGKPLKKGAFVLAEIANVPIYSVRIDGVKAKGFTILAVFIRSTIQLVQSNEILYINDLNIKSGLIQTKDFFTDRTSS